MLRMSRDLWKLVLRASLEISLQLCSTFLSVLSPVAGINLCITESELTVIILLSLLHHVHKAVKTQRIPHYNISI